MLAPSPGGLASPPTGNPGSAPVCAVHLPNLDVIKMSFLVRLYLGSRVLKASEMCVSFLYTAAVSARH